MGSLTPCVLVLAFAFFVDFVFIRFEERKLEETFGQAWLEYKGKVRRWV
jgi:protein-S-isoprenylcysteine O-methyltransferase Ste14